MSDPNRNPKRICVNCINHLAGATADTGECRCNPPALTAPLWPVVDDDDWCGRWTPVSGYTDKP